MKLNEIISDFTIFTTNEEEVFLKKMPSTSQSYSSFSERQQFILDSLIRKSLVSKIGNEPDSFLVKKNATWTSPTPPRRTIKWS